MAADAAALAAMIAAFQGVGLASRADITAAVAPLATQAQVAAAIAAAVAPLATQAQVAAAIAAAVAPLATQAQFSVLEGQVAQILALLAPHGVPAIAGAASAIMLATAAARAENARDARGVAFAVVPRADGTPPPLARSL